MPHGIAIRVEALICGYRAVQFSRLAIKSLQGQPLHLLMRLHVPVAFFRDQPRRDVATLHSERSHKELPEELVESADES